MISFLLGAVLAAAASAPLELTVDATDAPRGIFHARMEIPVAPGPLVLAYPKWIQGEHSPTGPIAQLAGLRVTAGGATLPWRRDPLDLFSFRVEVPAGAAGVSVAFDYLSPVASYGDGYGETPNATPHLAIVDWHDVVLFPVGRPADEIAIRARLRLPAGWKHDGALAATVEKDGTLLLPPVSLTTLLDSPVLAGDRFRTEVLEAGERPAIMSVAADRTSSLEIPADRLAAWRRLPAEALALFGARHYRSYHWLVALGDTLTANGLEHHECTDTRDNPGFFTDETTRTSEEYVLVHEYVHSWNGKYRRPRGLVARDPQQPLDAELLWVYEGLTRYLEVLLTARSGMRTPDDTREYIAWRASMQGRARPGRRWRPLADTAVSAQDLYGAPADGTSWRRSVDFYDESLLIWLEADVTIRERSGGARSLDDFCRDFFGGKEGAPEVAPYTRVELEASLGKVAPFDWRTFFEERVYRVAPSAPLAGLARSGWKLVSDARPNAFHRARATFNKTIDRTLSPGLMLSPEGLAKDVVFDSPAWRGGFGPGMKIVAVNGRKFTPGVFDEELNGAKGKPEPVLFTVEQGEEVRTLRVDAREGVLYGHLERDPAHPDLLAKILAPRRAP